MLARERNAKLKGLISTEFNTQFYTKVNLRAGLEFWVLNQSIKLRLVQKIK